MSLGELLKSQRERQKLKLNDVARLTDLAPSVVHRIETGETIGRFDTVVKIAVAIGLPPGRAFGAVLEGEEARILAEAHDRAERVRLASQSFNDPSSSGRRSVRVSAGVLAAV